MRVPFTQFLMPDGRRREVTFECKEEFDSAVKFLLDFGARFECEILSIGAVSLTVEFFTPDREDLTLAHEISANGPEVTEAVEKLITNAVQALKELDKQQVA